jgi:hypothetical protein
VAVRLRIDRTEEGGKVTVRVAGWLEADGTGELIRACAGVSPAMRVDLSELRRADPRALDVLLELERAGAVLAGVSPYVDLLLKARRREERRDGKD